MLGQAQAELERDFNDLRQIRARGHMFVETAGPKVACFAEMCLQYLNLWFPEFPEHWIWTHTHHCIDLIFVCVQHPTVLACNTSKNPQQFSHQSWKKMQVRTTGVSSKILARAFFRTNSLLNQHPSVTNEYFWKLGSHNSGWPTWGPPQL